MDLVLIRHGQSQWNADQTGGEDAPLTAKGRAQAFRAGVYCKAQFQLRALYASTYQRARVTAEIINSFLKLDQVPLLEDLREFSQDYSDHLPVFESPVVALQLAEPIRPAFISDYYITFHERVLRGLGQVLETHADLYETNEQIGIVSHGGVMGTIIRSLTGSHHFSLITENTGIYILRWEEKRWHIVAINRTEHLDCDRWQHEEGKDA